MIWFNEAVQPNDSVIIFKNQILEVIKRHAYIPNTINKLKIVIYTTDIIVCNLT